MTRKGFTLIELLVVVAVLALLASIVFSNLGGAREGARISNALSFQSQTHSLLGSDLIGWWQLDEESGLTASDISGYGNNGNIYGAIRIDGVPGTMGRALEFDGQGLDGQSSNGDYVQINSDDYSFEDDDSFTIALWARMYDSTRFLCAHRYHLSRSQFRTRGSQGLTVNTGIDDNDWHHITVTYDGFDEVKRLAVLVDGDEVDVSSITGSPLSSYPFQNLRMGMTRHSGGQWSHVIIDDVRIYSRALTASEVNGLYVQTKDNHIANEF